MPVYNAAPFLEDCLQSILSQSETSWELLAVDDHSTDHSRAILENYATRDARIKVLDNEGKGIIPALRLAFKESNGNLITRMDADDKMISNKLFLLQKALLLAGLGHLATGKVQYFSDQSLGQGYQKYEAWLNALTEKERNFEEIYKECVIPSPAWMLFREDLEHCGAFYSNTYPEDYDLCFRFFRSGLKVIGIPEVLHLWRDHSGRTSRNDPNYSNNQYFHLKVPYFLELHREPQRPLVLWGAGKKGKLLAQLLVQEAASFRWVCNQASKWGHQIYGVTMEPVHNLENLLQPQIIIAVAGPEDQLEIQEYLTKLDLHLFKDYFFFC